MSAEVVSSARPTLDEPDSDVALDLLSCQSAVLELVASGAPLRDALDCVTSALERLMPDSRCSILLLDREAGVLRHGSAPSLPRDYLVAIDGLAPGPDAGSCGTAAYLACPVIAEDVRADSRWVPFREIAGAAGLRACWSTPIVGGVGSANVVGTFAVYHTQPHRPSPMEQRIVERMTYLASIAIDHAAMLGALTVSEERFRRVFEDNAVPMALLDPGGALTRVNEALLRLAALPASDEAIGTPFADLLDPACRAGVAATMAGVWAGAEQVAHLESRILRADRSFVPVSVTMSLVRGARGEPLQLSVNILDMTARLAAQAERRARVEADVGRRAAEAASVAKSEFLSAVSHEMRTPLQAILGFAELLDTLDLTAARRHEAVGGISAGVTHLLALVDETLDLARIEAGVLPLAPELLTSEVVIGGILEFLRPLADRHGVRLVRDLAPGTVWADERRLRQVLINLVSNGIRYSGPGAEVRVGATMTPRGQVCVTVRDNGPGIPGDVHDRLFERFTRHEQTSGGDSGGVGLGLMLARGLTEAMGGQLTLSGGPGEGTTATMLLPAAPRWREPAVAGSPAAPPSGRSPG